MKKKPNWKVITFSLIALICLVLVFVVNWLFLIPAIILFFLNQKELNASQ